MKADLHIHTTHSDGAYAVPEILEMTRRLDYIAITDHDTFAGAKEAIALSPARPKIIYGIELTDYRGERASSRVFSRPGRDGRVGGEAFGTEKKPPRPRRRDSR